MSITLRMCRSGNAFEARCCAATYLVMAVLLGWPRNGGPPQSQPIPIGRLGRLGLPRGLSDLWPSSDSDSDGDDTA